MRSHPQRRILFTVVLLALCLSCGLAQACTIFSATLEDGTILACNNEDWMYSTPNTLQIVAGDGELYGGAYFYNMSYVQGGMNEYGLFYDGASCPQTQVPADDSKQTLGFDLGEFVLARCKTVKEAEALLAQYNIPSGFCDHLLLADEQGDRAVFEWINGAKQVIRAEEGARHQTVTNFWLTDPSLGGYPCARFDAVEDALQTQEPSFALCAQLLGETAQNWGEGGTLYSEICELTTKEICLYYRGDMDTPYRFTLTEQLKGMEPGERLTIPMEQFGEHPLFRADAQESPAEPSAEQQLIAPQQTQDAPVASQTPEEAAPSQEEASTPASPWLLPVIVVLAVAIVVLFVLLWRRKSRA